MGGRIRSEMNSGESEFDALTRRIAELDLRESELVAASGSRLPNAEIEVALSAIREQRAGLKEELAEMWARRSNRC